MNIIDEWQRLGHFERSVVNLAYTSLLLLEGARFLPMRFLPGCATLSKEDIDGNIMRCLVFPSPSPFTPKDADVDTMWFYMSRDEESHGVGHFECFYLAADDPNATSIETPTDSFYTKLTSDMLEIGEDGHHIVPVDSFVCEYLDDNEQKLGTMRFARWFQNIVNQSSSRPLMLPKPTQPLFIEHEMR